MSMISLGGSDWLGLGATINALSGGTAMCGSKPISGSTDAYDTCVARSLEISAQQSNNQTQIALDAGKNKTKMMVIALVGVAVIIFGIIIIRSRSKR